MFAFTSVLESLAVLYGFGMNSYSVDSDEVMKRGDEASIFFSLVLNASLPSFF
jgi:hypothetical protein